ncbi:MAG TPA: nuclear transport factor 2 family protein [Ilumatobacteraceae bacterium]|nr:nuclear transport factor 2 family protein [Ilumatobacteraceae bacterium]
MATAVDVVRRYFDSLGFGDPDAVAALVTDDFVNEHLSELGSGCTGRAEYRRRLPGFLSTFAGARYSIVDIGVLDSDRPHGVEAVVARYRFEAIFEGTAIDIPGVMWFEVRDALIARRTDLWDSLTFLRQTGQAD